MKKYFLIVFIVITLFLNCSNSKNEEKLVITTIYPYYLIANQIAGNKMTVKNLLPPNASPHTYSPSPIDLKNINDADLIIANGIHLEMNLERKIMEYDKRKVFFVSDSVKGIAENGNPHIWLDPIMLINITKYIGERIIQIDKKNRNYYKNNIDTIISKLNSVDSLIRNDIKDIKNRDIITYHNSFYYFLKRYDLHLAGIIQEIAGKEPTPKQLFNIGQIIKKKHIKAIFKEPELNPKSAEILAKEYELKIFDLDPLGNSININRIEELFIYNWTQMKKGL